MPVDAPGEVAAGGYGGSRSVLPAARRGRVARVLGAWTIRTIASPTPSLRRDELTARGAACVDRGTENGHHTAAEQAKDGRIGTRVNLSALTGVHQSPVGECSEAQRRVISVPSSSVIFIVALKLSKQPRGLGRTPRANSG